ncbi:hypothetical protein BLNAU_20255 [Blattamonas nauphoetae]|uniref:Uncharacterized protein n=1 Tax=Blattamonas nauphoetae TaxID=2049346 RepID=A0ABQ9WZT5_9EUKA|nr:hypothetical protein BLNAU_20255 [Blattamonas nauphoetae]
MEHPQDLALVVSQLETLFNILENQYFQLSGLSYPESVETAGLRERVKTQMNSIVELLQQFKDSYTSSKSLIASLSAELNVHLPAYPTVLYTPTTIQKSTN